MHQGPSYSHRFILWRMRQTNNLPAGVWRGWYQDWIYPLVLLKRDISRMAKCSQEFLSRKHHTMAFNFLCFVLLALVLVGTSTAAPNSGNGQDLALREDHLQEKRCANICTDPAPTCAEKPTWCCCSEFLTCISDLVLDQHFPTKSSPHLGVYWFVSINYRWGSLVWWVGMASIRMDLLFSPAPKSFLLRLCSSARAALYVFAIFDLQNKYIYRSNLLQWRLIMS